MTKFQGPVSGRKQQRAELCGRVAVSRNPGPEPSELNIPKDVIEKMFSIFSLGTASIIRITGLNPKQIKEITTELSLGETPKTEEFIRFRKSIEEGLKKSKER